MTSPSDFPTTPVPPPANVRAADQRRLQHALAAMRRENRRLAAIVGQVTVEDVARAAEIMAALGHRQLSTAQRYIHFAQNTRAALAERAAAPALAGLAAASGEPAAEVVTLADKKGRE